MARSTTARDIDSLPYHALQAEAAKYSIRRNLGSAKLKIAIKRVQETGGNTKDLPREWLMATAAESTEPSSSAASVSNANSRSRKIVPRPKASTTFPPRQARERTDRVVPSRIPSKTLKKEEARNGAVTPKNEADPIVKAPRDPPSSFEKISPVPSVPKPISAGPSTQEDAILKPSPPSLETVPKPIERREVHNELEKAIHLKAQEMGISGGVPPETSQFLNEIICEVLGGLLSGTDARAAVQKALSRKLIPQAETLVVSPELTGLRHLDHPDQPICDAHPRHLSVPDQISVPNNEAGVEDLQVSGSLNPHDSAQRLTLIPSEEALPIAQGSLRRKTREVETTDGPPMKKNKTSTDEMSAERDTQETPAFAPVELDENMTVIHTSLSPIIEDPQQDETRSSSPASPLNKENLLREPQSTKIFPSSPARRPRLLYRQGKPPGPPSPLSKPTLYGTEHMYGHSSAPFGELYDNTDMSFLYELAQSTTSKHGELRESNQVS
ncbi:hypothetical protein CROQUDRAFT_653761 [Cronartium quercuum f. sp. fusiforme G11]|uniref:Uncharacterized protein n=1 Tax=Cronartium quercuum f. sp. fusiforme G11 TaxID=708437 RepID=A0A9P6TFZ0_9BASI|nr:hypothetical protein CROQUDRAFT_653761 [Cronartium quercuum f. sp. fusiforme G11]